MTGRESLIPALRWWWAKLWRTRDYRYVVNDAKLPDSFYEAVADRLLSEHGETLRKLADDD